MWNLEISRENLTFFFCIRDMAARSFQTYLFDKHPCSFEKMSSV